MPEPTAGYQRFFAELKRRHVFKVAAIYGAVSFAVLQVADPLATALGLPDSFLSLVLGLLMLGFPVALVLAWAFEVTPEGVQKTESAAPGEIEAIVAAPRSSRWPSGLLALAGVALLFGGGWWMGQRSGSAPQLNIGVPEAGAAEFEVVAVLPFENVGGDADDKVLASGLEYDLQQKLGRLATLRAIAPGSVQEYGSSSKADDEIADELGADYIVRGSVLRAGSRVRVNVQLIDPATAENLWGEQYDRDVSPENLFEIQSEIATAVAGQLASRLSPQDVAALETGPPSESMAALAAYNRAREVYNTPAPGETWMDAAEHAERAVALDPEFVEAWSFLSRLNALLSQGDTTYTAPARDALARVEALAPGSVEAVTARAFHTYYVEFEFEDAIEQMERAEALGPSDIDVASGLAYLHRRLGQWDASLAAFKRAIALDPRSPHLLVEYAKTLSRLGRTEAADVVAERALQVGPGDASARTEKVWRAFDRHGDIDRARGLAAELGLNTDHLTEAPALASMALLGRDFDEAVRIADAIPAADNWFDEYVRLGMKAGARWYQGEDATAFGDSLSALDIPATPGIADALASFTATVSGDTVGALSAIDRAVRYFESNDDRWTALEHRSNRFYTKARLAGEEDALDELATLVELPGAAVSHALLRLDPTFDRLRDNPRFTELLERRRAFEEQAAREAEADRPWLP